MSLRGQLKHGLRRNLCISAIYLPGSADGTSDLRRPVTLRTGHPDVGKKAQNGPRDVLQFRGVIPGRAADLCRRILLRPPSPRPWGAPASARPASMRSPGARGGKRARYSAERGQ
jgi:hypothetical protein